MASNTSHVCAAFVSGVVVEALYAVGVLMLVGNHGLVAAGISVIWGAAFLFGVHESFKSRTAAVAYCIGLGVGTYVGSLASTV